MFRNGDITMSEQTSLGDVPVGKDKSVIRSHAGVRLSYAFVQYESSDLD